MFVWAVCLKFLLHTNVDSQSVCTVQINRREQRCFVYNVERTRRPPPSATTTASIESSTSTRSAPLTQGLSRPRDSARLSQTRGEECGSGAEWRNIQAILALLSYTLLGSCSPTLVAGGHANLPFPFQCIYLRKYFTPAEWRHRELLRHCLQGCKLFIL